MNFNANFHGLKDACVLDKMLEMELEFHIVSAM